MLDFNGDGIPDMWMWSNDVPMTPGQNELDVKSGLIAMGLTFGFMGVVFLLALYGPELCGAVSSSFSS